MKIGLVNNLFYPYERGGAERVCAQAANDWLSAGHEVFVFSLMPDQDKDRQKQDWAAQAAPYLSKKKNLLTNYYFPSAYYRLSSLTKTQKIFWYFKQLTLSKNRKILKKILQEINLDLLVTNNLLGFGLDFPFLANKLKVKQIHILHDIQLLHSSGLILQGKEKIINTWPARVQQIINRLVFKNITAVVSPSHWLLDLHFQKGFFQKTKANVIKNPLPIITEEHQEITNHQSKPENTAIQLFYAGQLEKHKGAEFLLNFFLKRQGIIAGQSMRLIFAGSGSLEKTLKEKASEREDISFVGRPDPANFARIFREIDLVIGPSLCYENYPTIAIDSAHYNKPFILSNLGGAPEAATDWGGLVFEAGNENDLEEKIKTVISQKILPKCHLQDIENPGRYGREILELIK